MVFSWSMCDIIPLCLCQILIWFCTLFQIECLTVIKIFYMSLSRKEDNVISCNSGFKPVLIHFTCYAMPLNGCDNRHSVYGFWDLCSLYVTEVWTVILYLTNIFFPDFQNRIYNFCVAVVLSDTLLQYTWALKQEPWSGEMIIHYQVGKWLMSW